MRRAWVVPMELAGKKGHCAFYRGPGIPTTKPIKTWALDRNDGSPGWPALEAQYDLMIECGFEQVEWK